MKYIKLEDGTIAEVATPDPRRVLTTEDALKIIEEKRQEVLMHEHQLTDITERKEALQAEILELNNLL
jgi:flagellar basal body rod protein FlgF